MRLDGRILRHSLSTLANSVLGELSGQQQADGRLNLARSERLRVVVGGQFGGLGRDTLEKISNERVHDAHSLRRDTGIRVNLLEHLVDVDGVGLGALLLALLLVVAALRRHSLLRDLLLSNGDRLASFGSHGGWCGVWWW